MGLVEFDCSFVVVVSIWLVFSCWFPFSGTIGTGT